MNNKNYIKPELIVLTFNEEDIIRTSGLEANQNGLLPDVDDIFGLNP